MLGEKTPEKGSGVSTPKQNTCEETIEIDISSPPAAATFDTRAAYAARVDEETSGSAARRDGSSGGADEPWVRDPRLGVWTMGVPSVGEAEPPPREDMEIRMYIPTPQAMGVREESASGASSLRMLAMP